MKNNGNESLSVDRVKASLRTIYTDIEIEASTEQVWSVLTDTTLYKQWASFLVDLQGAIEDGSKITTVFQLNPYKEKRNTLEHTISVNKGVEFYWAEKGPGGISDNHHFKVEALGTSKTRFIQSDEIKGGITWLMGGNLSKTYGRGYQAFNRSLKAEVERRFQSI